MEPTTGQISLDGKDITKLSPAKRPIAMVYQEFINYPRLTVFENIALPLRHKKRFTAKEIAHRVEGIAEIFGLSQKLASYPHELSGGQQQRTAFSRAFAKDAKILLLDEPLINLDYKLREGLRDQLREMAKSQDAIVIYTSTEAKEALAFGGYTAVMKKGEVLMHRPSLEVYEQPDTPAIAQAITDPPVNLISCRKEKGQLRFANTMIKAPKSLSKMADGPYILGIRPESIKTEPINASATSGKVRLTEITGSETLTQIELTADTKLTCLETGIHRHPLDSKINFSIQEEGILVYQNNKLVNGSTETHGAS